MPEIATAPAGAGALIERNYWAVVAECRLGPQQLTDLVAERFVDFAPPALVRFRRSDGADRPLRVGDDLTVHIRGAGTFGVRIVHRDRNSITIATLRGHPEVGRITFGAYRNDRGDVVFHIRSRARSSSSRRLLAFLAMGEPMQTNTWCDFVNNVALTAGSGVVGWISAETAEVEEEAEDRAADGPTFRAEGD